MAQIRIDLALGLGLSLTADTIDIENGKYTYVFDNDHGVQFLRHGRLWVTNPDLPKVWISAANELERLRTEVAELKAQLAAKEKAAG